MTQVAQTPFLSDDDTRPMLSIVIAVLNEQDNLPQVCRELAEACAELPSVEVVSLTMAVPMQLSMCCSAFGRMVF
jgi:dolichol-phosphate mannosyltransferase